jgi:hypothetical protein
MQAIDINSFLYSLAKYMAARAQDNAGEEPFLFINVAGTPRGLWINRANETGLIADPYSVLRMYGGPPAGYDPLWRASIQCETIGSSGAAAMVHGQALYESLLNAYNAPQPYLPGRGVTINGFNYADDAADGTYLIVSFDPKQRPGLLGTDDRGRAKVAFNFDVGFSKTS